MIALLILMDFVQNVLAARALRHFYNKTVSEAGNFQWRLTQVPFRYFQRRRIFAVAITVASRCGRNKRVPFVDKGIEIEREGE